MKSYFFLNYFIVVQLQLSAFFPDQAKAPEVLFLNRAPQVVNHLSWVTVFFINLYQRLFINSLWYKSLSFLIISY